MDAMKRLASDQADEEVHERRESATEGKTHADLRHVTLLGEMRFLPYQRAARQDKELPVTAFFAKFKKSPCGP
jgi:hypothetical protein